MFRKCCCNRLLIAKRFYHQENHYDVLRLKKDCSQKDIRKAFIDLSKEFHPDRQPNSDTHEKYVKILNAYKVLSQPGKRAEYDLGFATTRSDGSARSERRPYAYDDYEEPPSPYPGWNDKQFYHNRQKYYREQSGAPRTSFLMPISGGFFLVIFMIYAMTIWRFMNQKDYYTTKWQTNAQMYAKAKEDAQLYDTDAQIERMLKRAEENVMLRSGKN